MTAPVLARYCPVHHGDPAIVCPEPELADVLDTLRALDINPHLVSAHILLLDDCGGCADATWPRNTAVAQVSYTTHGGARYSEWACPLCVGPVVTFWRQHAADVEVFVPVAAGSWGSIVGAL